MMSYDGQQLGLPCDIFDLLVTYVERVRCRVANIGETGEAFVGWDGLRLNQTQLATILTKESKAVDNSGLRVTATRFRKALATHVSKIIIIIIAIMCHKGMVCTKCSLMGLTCQDHVMIII